MMGNIQKVNASYESFEQMTIEEARRLYIDVAEGYIYRYNQDKEIRPYLDVFPVTIHNFGLKISFLDKNLQRRDQGYVALIFNNLRNDHIIYCTYDPAKREYIDLYEEPYEIAREIVINGNSEGKVIPTIQR